MLDQLSRIGLERDAPTYKGLLKKRAMLMLVVNVYQPGFN